MIDLSTIGLNAIRKIQDLWSGAKADSLIEYTQVARVEPIVLIDTDVMYHDELLNIMQIVQSVFSGYYLQAMAISTNVGKVEVMKHLDKLNPHRNPGDSAANTMGWLLATENYKYRLPTFASKAALESLEDRISDDPEAVTATGYGRDTVKELNELSNLCVGKMLSVEITDGLHKATIPVAVRLMASSLPTASLLHILSIGSKDISYKERWHAWRSGEIEGIRDFVFCNDLIDAHRENLKNDVDGIWTAINKRRRSNQLSTIVSGNPSIATASNIVIMSSESISQLEMKINGKMSDFKVRQKVFKETYLMLMVVINKAWDRVTIYHRGLPVATDLSLSQIKMSNKGNGPDVSDILKAYQVGQAPSLK
jgi:hypothetical protein